MPRTFPCPTSIRQDREVKLFYRGGFTAVLVAGVMFAGGVAEAASPSAQKVCVCE